MEAARPSSDSVTSSIGITGNTVPEILMYQVIIIILFSAATDLNTNIQTDDKLKVEPT